MQRTACLSRPLSRVAMLTAVLILLTSSFDLFLIVEAGGNYRFCQIITPVLVVLAIVKAARSVRIPVLGAFPLLIWLVFQVSFIPVAGFWPKSFGYCLWLLLNLSLMFSYVQLFSDDPRSLLTVVRCYAYSFALVASFGMIQFLLPVLGCGGPLVTQWWIPGELARVNGFSYEPSYFATYLLIGFVFTGSLRRNHSSLLPARSLLLIHWLTAIGIILSSSRMGIFFLFIDVFLSQLRPWLSFLGDLLRLRMARFKLRALIPSFLSVAFIGVIATGTSAAIENNPAVALMFLNGTGISDTAAHSVIQREDALSETLAVFLQNPLIGRSLGGVSSAIADLQGDKIHSFEASKEFEGMSVFAEALAASGVIGIIPFVCFLVTTFVKPLRLARVACPFYSRLLYALLRSLLFAWMILQFNQNMLRPYLWTHLAILASVYAAALQSVNMSAGPRSSS
ncbi:MAG: hypothetical protein JWP08_3300 [Bryobacterales bacterium]|nr:hypothetical protein [Bryobacterales bacterium]